MSKTSYPLHRRINASLQFNGLKAQYIYYAGGIIIGSLLLFAILYISGVNSWICLLLVLGSGILGITTVYRFSHRYGEYGWQKKMIARRLPKTLLVHSRQLFTRLKK
jgi:hypothetical protein